MSEDEIIEMAREIAGQYSKAERFQTWTHDYMMQRLMELVAAEREACAKVCADLMESPELIGDCHVCVEAIRARGEA